MHPGLLLHSGRICGIPAPPCPHGYHAAVFNGYHWCQEIRRVSQVPILFLSSAAENINIVMAINMGADDFIAKPFDLSVLLAKVQAALRRAYDYQGQSHLLEHNGALFSSLECSVTYEGKKVELTKNETRMMQVLLENKPNVVSQDTLMAAPSGLVIPMWMKTHCT